MHTRIFSCTHTSRLCIVPGAVNCILIYASETPALQQKRDQSMAERTVRAVNHCRTALLAGYTTYRYILPSQFLNSVDL